MPAFSRGLLFRPRCAFEPLRNPHIFSQVKSCQQPRSFTSSSTLQALKKSRPPSAVKQSAPTTKPASTPTKLPAAPRNATYQSYASTLAQKGHPTLLYVAPSHTAFLISSYSGAAFCFSYAAFNFWSSYLNPPPGLSTWVPIAFGAICVGMSAMGAWLMLGPSRIVRTITAIPKVPTVTTAAGKNTTASGTPELQIEIELRKMFPVPFFPARKLYIQPEQLVMDSQLVRPVDRRLSPAEVHAMRMQEEAERQKQLEYERSHILSAPFRHMSRAFYSLFKAIGRTWTREGFVKVGANGKMYKLDITGGWALDGGKALDRLATLKPKV